MKVFLALSDNGDGSQSINWFKDVTIEQLEKLEEDDPDTWGSGDGLQYQELDFPDNFDFEALGVHYWSTLPTGDEDDDGFEEEE
jgi:hypothetical protein